MIPVLVATRSGDKLREITQILGEMGSFETLGLNDVGLPESAEEEGLEQFQTFEENALAKARYFARLSGRLVLADDSGVCVDALGGAPGVRSKRFSERSDLQGRALDEANNHLLLERLTHTPPALRTARYVCAVALVDPAEWWEEVTLGSCGGVILDRPRGSGGFGYDPLFFLPDEGGTFAEVEPGRKNEISHRARAVRSAGEILRERFADG